MRKSLAFVSILMLLSCGGQAAHTPAPAAQAAFDRAVALDKEKKSAEAMAAYVQAIEADPEFLEAHDGLAEARDHWKMATYEQYEKDEAQFTPLLNERNDSIEAKYREWERRFPDSLGIAYGMGLQLYNREDPRAKPYLLKVVAREPRMARIYYMLSVDADRWGDEKAALEYLRKAGELEPGNADYAYYYASALDDEAVSLDVVRRFPDSERGAQTLYWLGFQAPNDTRRIAFLEQLKAKFPPEKFSWSASGMQHLFEAYLRTDPARAAKFAREMQTGKSSAEWAPRAALAQTYIDVNQRVAAGKVAEAMGLLDKLTADRYSSNAAMLIRLKAQVMAGAGQAQGAYDTLLEQQAKSPADETMAAVRSVGKQLDKSPSQVDADLRAALDKGAKPAPMFALESYTSGETVSLEKLRGKVVFVTFWFPGCGPCRAEMPHFETVMRELRGKDVVYLGINGMRDQDAYVLPFMAKTKYSFIPLKGADTVTGQEGYKVGYYPSNFVIDRSGRIMYSNFMIHDAEGERMVRRMIESLL